MLHTPLSGFTDEELVTKVYADTEATWMELELAQRLEEALQRISELESECLKLTEAA
ncbi:MAG: hypothetical protein WBI41_05725 [Azovibrio sp.]|uniref:hypothetical protein n=1 Tax=Azovibrio sp. TaxID=1872673 RepID=UPI003C722F5C